MEIRNKKYDPSLPKFLKKIRFERENPLNNLKLTIHKVNKLPPIFPSFTKNKHQQEIMNQIETDIGEPSKEKDEVSFVQTTSFDNMIERMKKFKREERMRQDVSELRKLLKDKFKLEDNIDDYKDYYNIMELDNCDCVGEKQHLSNCILNKNYNRFIEKNFISGEIIDYQNFVNIKQSFAKFFPRNPYPREPIKLEDSIRSSIPTPNHKSLSKCQSKSSNTSLVKIPKRHGSLNNNPVIPKPPEKKEVPFNTELAKILKRQINKEIKSSVSIKNNSFYKDSTISEPSCKNKQRFSESVSIDEVPERTNLYEQMIRRKIRKETKPSKEDLELEKLFDLLEKNN